MKLSDAKLGTHLAAQLENLHRLRETYKKPAGAKLVRRLTIYCGKYEDDEDLNDDGDGTMDYCTIIPVNISHAVLDLIEEHMVADLKRLGIELPDASD